MKETALPLIVASIGAFLIPVVLRRTNIHHAVGEMVFGLILGRFGWFHEGELLKIVAEIGFLFLLFTTGMEIELKNWRYRKNLYSIPLALFIVTSPFLLLPFLEVSLLFLLSAGCTSVGILFIFLREYNLKDTTIQRVLLTASYGEIFTILILIFISESHGGVINLVKVAGSVLFIFIFAYLFFTGIKTFAWWFPEKLKPLFSEYEPAELGIRASFASVFILAGLCLLFDIEPVIGAFLAGIILSLTFREKETLYRKINAVTHGFFIPIFFIHIGSIMKIDVPSPSLFLLLFLFGCLSFITKLPAVMTDTLSWRNKVQLLFLLATPISMIVAIFNVGLKVHMISHEESQILFLYLLLSSFLNPVFARVINPPPSS